MILPMQKLSQADKEARHEKTGKNNIEETIDFYIQSCNWSNHTQEILSLYAAVEGHLDQDQYKLIQNPYNKQKDDTTPLQFNALLQNFNILRGIANLLMGEFGRRGHEYIVSQINPSDEMSFKDGLDVVIKNYYSQAVANSLLDFGLDVGQQAVELPPLDNYIQDYKQKFDSTRLISGQEVLDYIRFNCDLDSKYLDLYWDWIITGGFSTYKDVNHDEVTFEVVPRHELFTPIENHSRFIEDYSYAVRRQILPVYKVVDKFRGRIKEEIIDALEKEIQSGVSLQFSDVQMTGRNGALRLPTLNVNGGSTTTNLNSVSNGIELYHVVYKTWKPYYVLHYIDSIVGETTMEVGETYKLNKAQGDIKLEKFWENILYEGYKCLDYYLDCGPLLENRADLNQEGLQKLPYNGTNERSSTGDIQSLIKEGLPYQRKINTLHYQMEKLINKNKDKITVMPYGLVPRKKGMSTKDQMYHADATSILWVDETAPNAQFAAQMIKTLDMSLGTFIRDTVTLIQATKQEYWESIGMNAQRYADVGQNAGKAVTEQAITRSAIITYELTRQFDKVVEKDYTGLLDLSKLAYINGKKAKYIRGDSSIAFLNMNQDGARYHSENSYNTFVRDASVMTEAIQAMRGQAVNLIQNGGDMSVLGHLYQTNNIAKLTKILEGLDDNKKQYEQLMAENKQKGEMALQESFNKNDEANREADKYKVDMTYNGIVDSARIRVDADSSRDLARPDSPLEEELGRHKIDKDNKDLAIKEKVAESTIHKNNTNTKN